MMGEYQQREIVRLRAELQTADERTRVFQKDVERLTERYRCFQAEVAEQFAEDHAIIEQMDDCREQSIKRGAAQIKAEREVVNLRAEVERLKEELNRAWREVLGWKEGGKDMTKRKDNE